MSGQYLVHVEVDHHRAPRTGAPEDPELHLTETIAVREKPSWSRSQYVASALRSIALELDGDSTPAGTPAALSKLAKRIEERYADLPSTRAIGLNLLAEVATELRVHWQPPLIGEE